MARYLCSLPAAPLLPGVPLCLALGSFMKWPSEPKGLEECPNPVSDDAFQNAMHPKEMNDEQMSLQADFLSRSTGIPATAAQTRASARYETA